MPINTVSHWARRNLTFLFQPSSLLLVRVGGGCIAYPTFDWLSYHFSKLLSGFNYFSYFVIATGFLLISPVWEGLHEQISTSQLKLNLFFKDEWSKGSSRSTPHSAQCWKSICPLPYNIFSFFSHIRHTFVFMAMTFSTHN